MEKFVPATEKRRAPATPFTDAAGRNLSLADFRGRLVLVNFWATWCGPCVREMPSLERLHKQLGGADFTVIALSEDRKGWEVIAPFRTRIGLGDLPLFHDLKSETMFSLKGRGLPTTILFDREGYELGRLVGPAEWDTPEAVALIRYYLGTGTAPKG